MRKKKKPTNTDVRSAAHRKALASGGTIGPGEGPWSRGWSHFQGKLIPILFDTALLLVLIAVDVTFGRTLAYAKVWGLQEEGVETYELAVRHTSTAIAIMSSAALLVRMLFVTVVGLWRSMRNDYDGKH